uniref:Uncharacterized protein n=1 Tax=Panagrolaimus davidi TaxID=227884 RepID=A0A914QR82_9BILA
MSNFSKIEESYTFEDLENYGKRLRISTAAVLLFNIFTGYIVLKHSNESMEKYKYYILLTVISAALMDLDAAVIFGIYPTFPLPGFCGAGLIAKHLNWFWGEVIQYVSFSF